MAVLDDRGMAAVTALLAAAAATEVMPRFRRLAPADVRAKSGPFDLVTEADEAAERVIAAGLRARFPGCVVVGEEATAADPALLGALRDAPLAFVVDPIDGTANFVAGLPLFGCMAAAISRGAVVAAWIHDPLGRDTAAARLGGGAWTEDAAGARTPLRVAAPAALSGMTGAVSWRYLPEGMREAVAARTTRLGATIDLRCAAHLYRMAASGHAHLLVFHRLMPWDHAPGWLLHREAGGYSARFDGSPYSPLDTEGGIIAAPDRAGWEAARTGLLGDVP